MELTLKEYLERARKLYGEDTKNIKYRCSGCGKIQSAISVKEQMDKGIPSQRHGLIDVTKTDLHVESECYQPNCNWVAYGLFTSNIAVIIEPDKPHNSSRTQKTENIVVLDLDNNPANNYAYVFPLADDVEMLKAAGIT